MIKNRFNYEDLFNNMVEFTANYIVKNKLEGAVLGISGGIDSTVVAALLYEVSKKLRADNYDLFSFHGYSLPTSTTHSDEYLISTFVGNAFADDFEIHDIGNISHEVFNDFTCGKGDVFSRGNIKARLRMIYLYDKAKTYKSFVVGTDNYTEMLLGFSTIGGDALADYMPIQYLWKTEVYGLANYLLEKYKNDENWPAVNALNASINIIPQDGLGISTSDMVQIGAKNYFDVDEILYAYEKLNLKYETFTLSEEYRELCKKFEKNVVDKVLNRRIKNFKLDLPIIFNF